jgi:hypothetical protein
MYGGCWQAQALLLLLLLAVAAFAAAICASVLHHCLCFPIQRW